MEIEFKDDENPMPVEIEEDEEGGSKLQDKNKKVSEEDEDMVDEY